MSLAQVVYSITNDKDFAAQMRRDPEDALAQKGWSLSREELAFLTRSIWGGANRTGIRMLTRTRPRRLNWM
ncbi:MAG: hypothetical protein PVG32_17760 [Anaerolineales bacterium]|jgi:hypothetical protein